MAISENLFLSPMLDELEVDKLWFLDSVVEGFEEAIENNKEEFIVKIDSPVVELEVIIPVENHKIILKAVMSAYKELNDDNGQILTWELQQKLEDIN